MQGRRLLHKRRTLCWHGVLQQAATRTHQRHDVFNLVMPGHHGGGIFTHAMAEHQIRRQTQRLPMRRHRQLESGGRRLGILALCQGGGFAPKHGAA